ncbi:unnamed protein product [Rhizoctonia solani]|uniref:Extracellular metalloproteinase n=1 Tax=Rhizoctonia solani TaxID=456999 RepID=A0A8H3DI38_9AGAM|nr:unnamed protein product [Rhizoctonia solani]
MRLLCSVIALSFAYLASSIASPTRKSLRFGSRHPTARYVTRPHINSTLTFATDANPLDVARAFIRSHTESDYYIRNDSYTDKNTGITHVYVRQLFNGLEVADGNINLNIRDGRILSFGDSFFQGTVMPLDTFPLTFHAAYCAQYTTRSRSLSSGSQIPLYEKSRAKEDWYALHCDRPLAAVGQAAAANIHKDLYEPRRAALYFMIAAHPEPLVVDKLVRDFGAIIERMTLAHEHISLGQDIHQSTTISGLPGTVNPVKARMVYVQVPTGNETALYVTWRLEVEMADNWYEAYVSVREPSAIVSVIDWASDSSPPSHGGFLNALEAKLAHSRYTEAGAYKVWRWGINDPESGERTVEPASYDSLASPLGWHAIPRTSNPDGSPDWIGKGAGDHGAEYLNFTTTWGNNVFAQENWQASKDGWISHYRPEGGKDLAFAFEYGLLILAQVFAQENWQASKDGWISQYRPEGGKDLAFAFEYGAKDRLDTNYTSYSNLSITQLFYTSNMVHDLYYRYGFDEPAGNFQQDNFGQGGRGNDAIIANAQSGGGLNNAYFMAPPDGQHGRCHMYIWDTAIPYRDGSLDAGIVIHELTHGLSNRLTGGPDNAGCLPWGEGAGMGEGWGDFLATTIRSAEDYHDYAIGSWASNQPNGVRKYLYSKNMTVNPSMYSTLNDPEEWTLHDIGAVWAEILWVTMQRMIQTHGYSPTLFPPAPMENGSIPLDFYNRPQIQGDPLVPKHGNTLMLQLVILGMKLQPCRPSFFGARDAIILADQTLTGGENLCDLWAGFSSRGLGRDAAFIPDHTPWGGGEHIDGFAVPKECE